MTCAKVITLCNGDETCAECSPPSTICDVEQQYVAACEPFTLQFCISAECVAASDEVELTLRRVNAPSGETPYTDLEVPADPLVYQIAEDALKPGWHVATLELKNSGAVVKRVTIKSKLRVVECRTDPAALTCLTGDVPATVPPDATSFKCCP